MGRNASEIERAVTRTLRDSLEKLQRNTEEVTQTVSDLVSACSSARPGNILPHMLRAQTAAASLAATLDVLSRFITAAIQPAWSAPFAEDETSSDIEIGAWKAAAGTLPGAPAKPQAAALEPEPAAVERALRTVAWGTSGERVAAAADQSAATPDQQAPAAELAALEQPAIAAPEPLRLITPEPAPSVRVPDADDLRQALELVQQAESPGRADPVQQFQPPAVTQAAPPFQPLVSAEAVVERRAFDLAALPPDQQELHRRANRVAKVSMQDIKMLRPGDVRAGKENNDLCLRLRDDIERAHKEYERRFHAILDQPVDYFYAWMVEILGEGDSRSLGEYPYTSSAARR